MLRLSAATLVLTLALLAFSPALAQTLAPVDDLVGTTDQSTPSPLDQPLKRRALGYGRLMTNDVIGDGQDRWRTGSVTVSGIWGYRWDGAAPSQLGQLLETRVQGQVIAPSSLTRVNTRDRPYAGALSVGLHTHSNNDGLELSLGADLVIVGPQTRLDQLQKGLHKAFGEPALSPAVLALQVGDTMRPTLVAELGRSYRLGNAVDLRPFAEARAGDETLLRIGADLTIGSVGQGELLVRESITGQRYRLIYRSTPGYSVVVGGDVAYVSDSIYLPKARGYQLTDHRGRFRVGLHWQGENTSILYGLTYLGREFTGQPEGQVTGSIRVKMRF
jgi:hypothetical protein